jgi:hypothetical protein
MMTIPMGCFGFIADLLGFSVVKRGWRANARLTAAALLLFWGWAFVTGFMVVRYAHLGEYPYVFEILPIVSCISPIVAFVGVILFTLSNAVINFFSSAITHSFGIAPPFNLYTLFGKSQPLLTWGAYIRLNLVGLMSYALLPGIFSRLMSRLFQGMIKGTKKAVHTFKADGPPPKGFVPPPDPEGATRGRRIVGRGHGRRSARGGHGRKPSGGAGWRRAVGERGRAGSGRTRRFSGQAGPHLHQHG